jgi:N-acetylglucosamine-6-sulfatase
MQQKYLAPLFAAVLTTCVSSAVYARDNIILIQTDDMTPAEMKYLPRTRAYLNANGTTFTNAFVSNAMCCSSRATTLTGCYSQNTGIHNNSGPNGGFSKFHSTGLESHTIATQLKSAGYTTAYFGKYLNQYGSPQFTAPTYVPPGWDHWYALSGTIKYFDYKLNENGHIVAYGTQPADYSTDVFAAKAQSVLTTLAAGDKPFFMMISPFAPHVTTERDEDEGSRLLPVPAPRHENLYPGLRAPRSASFDEADVADKPDHIRRLPKISAANLAYIDRTYRARAQSLRAVDDMVGDLIDRLNALGEGGRTQIMFMSDNGYFFGDHRIVDGKGRLYDPSHRIPLLVAGPGLTKGALNTDLVVNTDIAPTIAAMAGLSAMPKTDGRSLLPQLTGDQPSSRRSFLMSWSTRGFALRTKSNAYIETKQGKFTFRELYDMNADPEQMNNLASKLTAASSASLKKAVADLSHCTGAQCRTLEDSLSDALVVRAH